MIWCLREATSRENILIPDFKIVTAHFVYSHVRLLKTKPRFRVGSKP